MKFKDNPNYSEVFTLAKEGELPIKFYVPNDNAEGYHVSRFAAAQSQAIYSSSGATAELLNTMMDSIISICNDVKKTQSTIRTDIGVLANQIKYRTKYPIDEDCCLRMSAIYCFIEGEDPDKVSNDYINKKGQISKGQPRIVHFFFAHGNTIHTKLSGIVEGFKRHGLFQDEGGSDKGINTTAPHKRVEDLYDSYRQTALRFCKGDMQKADYFLDTSVYEYFYRIVQENKYIEWHNENMKPKTTGKAERENP